MKWQPTLMMAWAALLAPLVSADFDESEFSLHPAFPGGDPFIIEIEGTWPSDCHPGEQKPVIADYDGGTARIEFEIIVVHVTCNDTPTPYRVLVDMRDVVGEADGDFESIEIEVGFDEQAFTTTLPLVCKDTFLCAPGPRVRPDTGLYTTPELKYQGIVLVRQGDILAGYPLQYDEAGQSQWRIAAGQWREDAFFQTVFGYAGGQCQECPDAPHGDPTEAPAGQVTMLFDAPDTVQVRFDNGLFREYRAHVFGYPRSMSDGVTHTALTGRWALDDPYPTAGSEAESVATLLPLVFDLTLEVVLGPAFSYGVHDLGGARVAALECDVTEARCRVFVDELDSEFEAGISSHRRLQFETMGGGAAGTALRLD
jgi:hypothetical protein